MQLLGGQDLGGDGAKDRAHSLTVSEDVGAEATEAGDFVGEVCIVPPVVLLAVHLGHDLADQAFDRIARQRRRGIVEACHATVDTTIGAHADREVQIRCPTLAHGPEQRVDRVTSPGDRRWGGRPLGHGPIRERHTLRPGVARWRAVGRGVLTRRGPTRRCRAGGPDKANDHGRTVSVDLDVVGLTGARCVAERDDGIATEPAAGLRRNHRDEQLEHILPRHGHRLRIALGLPHYDARRTANLEH